MKTLYLDCGMGAAGDMLTAALFELLPDREAFLRDLEAAGIPGVRFQPEPMEKCGITGTHMGVTVNGEEEESLDAHLHAHPHEEAHCHDHGHHDLPHHGHSHEHHEEQGHTHGHEHTHGHGHHHHSGLQDIGHIVMGHLQVSQKVKEDVMAVYGLIAEAESHAHGVPVSEIHFHEVGTLDAVADITAVCMLMERLAPDQVIASPVHVGSGHVHCAHGILPVPAPATAYILKDVPIYGGQIEGELCTPTGAALLKHFATGFGSMPVMKTEAIGYGMGKKDFPAANCLRAFLGETEDRQETVPELSCNVDDMTAEQIGFALERFFDAGALEAYTLSIGMKKSRPGTLIRVICREEDKEALVRAMFRYTSTIGIRETSTRRYVLDRQLKTLETEFGPVQLKTSRGYGISRSKYEYEDLARIAREKGLSLEEVLDRISRS